MHGSLTMDIFQRFSIEAAHLLPHLPAGHKCARLHGHSFQVEIHLQGPVRQREGWVQDLGDIHAAFQPLHDQLDHHYLNDIEGLENPTCEHLAHWIWQRLQPHLPLLSQVIIGETCTTGCSYRGED